MKKVVALFISVILVLTMLSSVVFADEDYDPELVPLDFDHAVDIDDLIADLPDLPDPTGTKYYFYRQLNDIDKVIYQKIMKASFEQSSFSISGLGDDTISDLYLNCRASAACLADNPFLHAYWEKSVSIDYGDDGSITCQLEKMEFPNFEIVNQANARADAIVNAVGIEGDLYTRLRKLVTIMAMEMDYNPYYPFNETNTSIIMDDCVLSCLVYDNSVCAGFADTFKYLCDRLSIPCITVGNAGHAWNFVQMENGRWYSVDTSAIANASYFEENDREQFIEENLLLGSASTAFITNENYHLSKLYLYTIEEDDISFPVLSEDQYLYDGIYSETYSPVPEVIAEDELTFIAKTNEDGVSCTIVGVNGGQGGDLIIPAEVNGLPVTAIGDDAFRYCKWFKGRLELPDSVTSIGIGAFLGCENLSGSLVLPENLETIGNNAFIGCEGLTGDVILPEKLAYLGNNAFYGCTHLCGSFYIPSKVDFDQGIISGTAFSEIIISKENAKYQSINGVVFSKDGTILLCCPPEKSGELIIPETVVTIADNACSGCKQLTRIQFPESLLKIGRWAFQSCNAFEGDLILPDSIEEIGYAAFADAVGADHDQFTFDRTLHLPAKLKRLGDWAFTNCCFGGELFIPDTLEIIMDPDGIEVSQDNPVLFAGDNFDYCICSSDNNYFIEYYNAHNVFGVNGLRIVEPKTDYNIEISYNANGGDNVPETINTMSGLSVVISPSVPVLDGYIFLGWADSPESETVLYRPNGKYYFEDSTVLYAVWADEAEAVYGTTNGFSWVVNKNEATITGFLPSESNYQYDQLMIPDYVEGYPVSGIADCVFSGAVFYNIVHLPDNLKWIGANNFVDSYIAVVDYHGEKASYNLIDIVDTASEIKKAEYFYTWADDYSIVTATRISEGSQSEPDFETVATNMDISQDATCTVSGTISYYADFSIMGSNRVIRYVDIPAIGHTEEIIPAVPATCTEPGLTEGKKCSVCGEVLVAQEEIPALGHALVHHEAKAATCAEAGWDEYDTCSRCNYTTYAEIPATGHTEVVLPATAPTCTEAGLTEGKKCSVCGEVLVVQEEIPALDHDYQNGVCMRCGDVLSLNGWVKTDDGIWHYYINGTMTTGWQKVGGTWYYMDEAGNMLTGWQKVNDTWYYLKSSGAMATGWLKDGNTWYYLKSSGAMATGWLKDGNTWYYLKSSGAMATGWLKISNKWYFFKSSGAMAASEWCEGYWLNANGSWTYQPKGSWKQDSTGWWFGDTSGWYAKNTTIKIDNKNYTFDALGYWVK